MQEKRNYLLLILKGCAMGAADVVPGVSGGTIAFVSGIYEELINSIKNIDWQAVKFLFSGNFCNFWKKINGDFLLAIVSGIGISIFSLAKLMVYLLTHHPILIWSFFFGLIIASSILVAKEIKKWDVFTVFLLLMGACTAYTITVVSPGTTPNTWWFIMLSGAIAICAMILPGVSGAFVLLLMGKYAFIMAAVSDLKIGIIAIFAAGAVIGIISFSHLLAWLLKNFHTLTVAILTGFMVGSLNKIWPWKEIIRTYRDSNDIIIQITIEESISPATYATLTRQDPLVWQAILMCIIGFVLIWGIEMIGKKYSRQKRSKLSLL